MADTKFFSDMLPFFYRIPVLYVDVGAHKGEMYKLALQSGLAISEAHLVEPNQRSGKVLRELLEQIEFSKKKSAAPLETDRNFSACSITDGQATS